MKNKGYIYTNKQLQYSMYIDFKSKFEFNTAVNLFKKSEYKELNVDFETGYTYPFALRYFIKLPFNFVSSITYGIEDKLIALFHGLTFTFSYS